MILAIFSLSAISQSDRTNTVSQQLLMDFGGKFHKGDLQVNHFGKLTKSANPIYLYDNVGFSPVFDGDK